MQAMLPTLNGTHLLPNIRAQPELETTSRGKTIWNLKDPFTNLKKCWSKLDCLIYEMLYIRDPKPVLRLNQSETVCLINIVFQ